MTFLAPLSLIALVAVAVPVVVHLFHLRRYRRVLFSDIRNLQSLQHETRQQNRLRERLILASRILAIAFLVVAFAQPVLVRDAQPVAGESAVSLFVDNTFSMQNADSERPLLETARNKAREIVQAYRSDDRFQLLTADMAGHQSRWLSRDECLEALDAVRLTSASVRLDDVARRQADFLATAPASRREAYLVSDFQSSALQIDRWPTDTNCRFTLVPLPASAVANLFVDSLSLSAPVSFAGSRVSATVWLRNTGTQSAEQVPVRLFLDGHQRALASVDVAAGSTEKVQLSFVPERVGSLAGRVETTDYPVTFDDTLYFAIDVKEQVDMLLVEGAATENRFIRQLFAADSSVRYTSVSASRLDMGGFDRFQFVIFDELHAFSSGMADAVVRFVEEGGSVLLVPSADADVASYNALLLRLQAPTLTTFQRGETKCDAVNTDGPLYAGVFNTRSEQPELPTLQGHFGLESQSTTDKERIILLTSGGDYLVATRAGSGRLYLFTAPLVDEATDFVRQALFVPTLYNMALHSQPQGMLYADMGRVVPSVLSRTYDAGEVARLASPDGTFELIPELLRRGNRTLLATHGAIPYAGHYRLAQGETDETVAFNYSRIESVLDYLSADDLGRLLHEQGIANTEVLQATKRPLDTLIRQKREGTPLWKWFFVASLVMLVAESALTRLPRRSSKQTTR